MSGAKLNNFTTADVNLTAIMNTLTQATKGHFQLSITEFTTTALPAIAAGSIIEVDGAMFKFDADLAITGTPTDGVVYIKLVPSATACTAEFTNTAPVWDDSKQGWYGVTGYGAHRYVVKLTLTAGVYLGKRYLNTEESYWFVETQMVALVITPTWLNGVIKNLVFTFAFPPVAIVDFNLSYVYTSGTSHIYRAYYSGVTFAGNTVTVGLKQLSGATVTGVGTWYATCTAIG